jgi:hypothetical protein
VLVIDQGRKMEWAYSVRELLDVHYPDALKIRLVCDNLNTHTGGALYQGVLRQGSQKAVIGWSSFRPPSAAVG